MDHALLAEKASSKRRARRTTARMKRGGRALAGRRRATEAAQERGLLSDPSDKKPDAPQSAPPPSVGTGPDCRAGRMGDIKEFAECWVDPARPCPYAVAFGKGRFCLHPQRELIIARTEAGEESGGG